MYLTAQGESLCYFLDNC